MASRPAGCAPGDGVGCRWQLPVPGPAAPYALWRHTRRSALWGRPGLVGLVLGVVHGFARLYPGERVVVGDLDAPGPRHALHRSGRDVDLYLPGVMLDENVPGTRVRPNYAGRSRLVVRMLRGRVEDLARLVATCSAGRVTIFYNDPVVLRRFDAWLGRHAPPSWRGPGRTMRPHNALHRFHFHVRMTDDLPPPATLGAH